MYCEHIDPRRVAGSIFLVGLTRLVHDGKTTRNLYLHTTVGVE